ncbi:MAG: hypothetical protein O2848_03180 [Proteobacteria bacterium]|jgi:hypothetical protein|nr:hypothetical protein [Pseudomonadota bacterium]MDA0847968.1 hypothetical protein [Pseudomonadota bacterium]
MSTYSFKTIPESVVLDYTREVTVILYEGGAAEIAKKLFERGITEVFFDAVRGAPLGKASDSSGLPEIPKTEQLSAIVSADQADYIQGLIYEEAELFKPQRGIVFVNKLLMSTRNILPSEQELAARAAA